MNIQSYFFGRITINDQKYSSDVLLFNEQVVPHWQRKIGHSLEFDDLNLLLEHHPEIIIIGTGQFGILKVPLQLKEQLKQKNITLIAQRTGKAIKTFNQLTNEGKHIVAGLHLTC